MPRVWCWDDAWKATARRHADPPARLSKAALFAVLAEAIERAGRSGSLDAIARAAELPGYRRTLLGRFAAWTVEERSPARPAPADSPVDRAEWAVFGEYRATLGRLKAEDPEGFARWASRMFLEPPSPELTTPGHVVVLDPTAPSRAEWRLLDWLRDQARSMTVILPHDPDPALAELYACVEPTRRRFLEAGFIEKVERSDGFSYRPPGLEFIERDLFRDVPGEPARTSRVGGLSILGGPRGEGLGLLIAREVRSEIESGTEPESILILVPRLDSDAERIREVLSSWGLPVAANPRRKLANVPAISALRLASRLPIDRWEVATLVRLLRNGQVRWSGGSLGASFGPAEAASAIRSTRVFRDRATLRSALASGLERKDRDRPILAALDALDRLTLWIDPVAKPGPWRVQVDRLRNLAVSLGLDPGELEPLWDALEDRGWVLDGLGPAIAEESLSWGDFVEQLGTLVAEVELPGPPAQPGTIRIATVGESEGARAACIVLASLGERTFPSPESIDLEPAPEGRPDRPNLAYSREMLDFARVAGSADERLVLAYPMTDVDGEPLLPSGFLDELIRRLDGPALRSCVERHARFDPVLMGHEELARSPVDARVLAVAKACSGEDFETLRRLAGSPAHAESLGGTAEALVVAGRRRVDPDFGPYDGRLRDPAAIVRIAADFGPGHAFSPSQLESFALCPFQFYQRYVLGLKVVDERRELDEDYAGRGSHVHDVLERIHQQVAAEGEGPLIERLGILIETDMRVELERHDGAESDVAQVLREIGTRRTNKTLARYVGQFANYAGRAGESAEPHRFEVLFGQPDTEGSHSHLKIGQEGDSVLLQGKIDRIDLVRKDGKLHFRVIDYKTGSCPSGQDVRSGLASQLPLYALAVEQLLFPSGDHELMDVGYWSLPKDGYKDVKLKDWDAYRDHLATFVVQLVRRLRQGDFPIEARKKDCRDFCDFRSTCRVVEVRASGKAWRDRPELGKEA